MASVPSWTANGNTVKAGIRYFVGIVAPGAWTQVDAATFFAPDWFVETVAPGSVSGAQTSWRMIGLARKDNTLVDTSDVNFTGIYREVPAGQQAPALPNAPPDVLPNVPSLGRSVGATIGYLTLGAVGLAGIAYGAYLFMHRGAR